MVNEPTTIITERLRLRPLALADASDIQRLAGDTDIASTTRSIPHPYPDGYAERWIGDCQAEAETGALAIFAITLKEDGPEDGAFVGIVELQIDGGPPSQQAQLSYWIGKPYWSHGYATEAANAVVKHGFTALGLDRVGASHFGGNPASGRVLQKIGMSHEGTLEQNFDKWGTLEDVVLYGMPKSDLADSE
jgi:RimJ/RimL family protein N-acetyltransferase